MRRKQARNINCPLRIPMKLVGKFGGKRRPVFITVAGVKLQVGWAKDHREEK